MATVLSQYTRISARIIHGFYAPRMLSTGGMRLAFHAG